MRMHPFPVSSPLSQLPIGPQAVRLPGSTDGMPAAVPGVRATAHETTLPEEDNMTPWKRSMRRIRLLLLLAAGTGLLAAAPAVRADRPWQILEDCEWVECPNNDGDSFKVQWNGGELTIRLYFTDTPEISLSYGDRIRAQADYFGITPEQAVKVGRMARDFTREVLQDGFSVRTRWQGVFGGQRALHKYGIVLVDGSDLAELLVANGLARIHGMGIRGQTWEEVKRLRELEAEAKAGRKGAWGIDG